MVDKRLLWAGVALVGALVGGVVLFWRLTPRPETGFRELTVSSRVLARLPMSGAAVSIFGSFSLPTDLDGDGMPERVLDAGRPFPTATTVRGGRLPYAISLWIQADGTVDTIPEEVIYPLDSLYDPGLPPLRELIVQKPRSTTYLRLTRRNNRWHTELLRSPQNTTIFSVYWVDRDGNGFCDALAVIDGRSTYYLVPNAKGQLEWVALSYFPAFNSLLLPQFPGSVSPTFAFLHRVWLGDLDGDGNPEQFDTHRRIVLLSRGHAVVLPHPKSTVEQVFAAEMDGQAPRELVCVAAEPHKTTVYMYHPTGKKLTLQAAWSGNPLVDVYLRDFDGDGQDELLIGTDNPSKGELRLHHIRLFAGKLQVRQRSIHAQRSSLGGISFDRFRLQTKLPAFSVYVPRQNFLLASQTNALCVAGIPKGATDIQQWQVVTLRGMLLWAGDYDGDGAEEFVLTAEDARGGCQIAQFRDGVWYLARLKHRAPATTATAAHIQGKPHLVILYADGTVEAVQLHPTQP